MYEVFLSRFIPLKKYTLSSQLTILPRFDEANNFSEHAQLGVTPFRREWANCKNGLIGEASVWTENCT